MKYRKYLNIVLFIIIMYYWLAMFFEWSDNMLGAKGISSLKYFTVLSNLFEALSCLIWLIKKDERIKYIASVSVGLTFFTVMLFMGPVFGYNIMFIGSNFWFHLVVPIVAILEVIFLNRETFSYKDNMYSVVPMLVYGVFYVGNVLINGVGQWPHTNDWYGFFAWGYEGAVAAVLIIVLATYFIGFAIRRLNNKYNNFVNNRH